ncbi:uncharacterized protein LOC134771908 [Penaeus indicus]|uniref:uncharacterized protein LOC134771908 n=1 Tax=Penaeus indicus TaxID=29960 RepID=UPI00300CE420
MPIDYHSNATSISLAVDNTTDDGGGEDTVVNLITLLGINQIVNLATFAARYDKTIKQTNFFAVKVPPEIYATFPTQFLSYIAEWSEATRKCRKAEETSDLESGQEDSAGGNRRSPDRFSPENEICCRPRHGTKESSRAPKAACKPVKPTPPLPTLPPAPLISHRVMAVKRSLPSPTSELENSSFSEFEEPAPQTPNSFITSEQSLMNVMHSSTPIRSGNSTSDRHSPQPSTSRSARVCTCNNAVALNSPSYSFGWKKPEGCDKRNSWGPP